MNPYILLIEDSPSDAAILLAAFENIGYAGNIQIATDGIGAIQELENISLDSINKMPQLILLDLNLPRKNGLEVLEEIKTNSHWQHIPTIIFSSSSAPKDIEKSYQLHANAYLAKPRELKQYQLTVQQLHNFWLNTAKLPEN